MGTLVTLEGTSYPTEAPDAEPVFGAFAVAALVEDQVRLSAYQGGHVLDCVFDLSPGRYAWQVPGPDGATVDYRATFDSEHWTEIGTLVVDGADREVFRMTLHR